MSKEAALAVMRKAMKSEGLSHTTLIGNVKYALPSGGGNGCIVAHFMSTQTDSSVWFIAVDEHKGTSHLQFLGSYSGYRRILDQFMDVDSVKEKVLAHLGQGHYSELTLWMLTARPSNFECYGCGPLLWDFLYADSSLSKVTQYYVAATSQEPGILILKVQDLWLEHFRLLRVIVKDSAKKE